MEIQYYGANCLSILLKKTRVIVDDNLSDLGLKSITSPNDIYLQTNSNEPLKNKPAFSITQPGEYEVSNISIQGIAARSHTDEEGKKTATIFKLIADDIRVVIAGHIYPDLSEEQLESIGTIDILLIPVGGNGYTLDGIGALKVIKEIGPKLVIPTHYADSKIKYPVPQKDLQESLKELAMEPKESIDKLKLKDMDFADTTQLIVLERQ